MKIAISLPDELSANADNLATKLGLSRSRLIALALAEFIAKHRASKVTERLDAVYATEESTVDRPVRRAQRRAVDKPEW
jgi:metal-responsive CopG/Arc/MetJ family transcriptional regulator